MRVIQEDMGLKLIMTVMQGCMAIQTYHECYTWRCGSADQIYKVEGADRICILLRVWLTYNEFIECENFPILSCHIS